MNKALIPAIAMSLLVIASCTKTTPATDGSWTFKSTTYSATSIATTHSAVTVFDQLTQTSTNYQTLSVNFYYSGLPTSAGTFIVKPGVNIDSVNQVYIVINNYGTGDTIYQATGGNGAQTVQVSVSSGGQLSISGSGIEMINGNNPADSSALSFSITQPQ